VLDARHVLLVRQHDRLRARHAELWTSDAPKNLSSAVHMNGLLTTVVPASTACLRYERYIGTSCEMRSTMTSYGTSPSCAGAPIFTNSTVTPASRFCHFLDERGRKDHSRPTIKPTR
jgi:hypothetical protein